MAADHSDHPSVCVMACAKGVMGYCCLRSPVCVCVMACSQGVSGCCSLRSPVCVYHGLSPRSCWLLLPQIARLCVWSPASKGFWASAPSGRPSVCVVAWAQGVLGYCSLRSPVCAFHGMSPRCLGLLLSQITCMCLSCPCSKVFRATASSDCRFVCVMACLQGGVGGCSLR